MSPDKSFQLLPESASTFASRMDWLALFLLAVSVTIVGVVFLLVVYFGLKYQRRRDDEVPPEQPHGNWLEITLSGGLFCLFMVMFAWGAAEYVDMRRPPAGAIAIDVVGKQWMWKLQHPAGQREINELHVPVGRPVRLTMTSLDVIHSFGVPAFRIKQDVLPGNYTTQWFEATKPGFYDLYCQEYCGTDHSAMRGRIVVMEPKDYDAWLSGTPADQEPAVTGARLFATYGCNQCHGQNAPTLAGLYGRTERLDDGTSVVADEAYLRESILNPSAKVVAGYGRLMPTYRGQLTEEQVQQMVAYMKTLGQARGEGSSNGAADAALPATRPLRDAATIAPPNVPPTREPPPPRDTQPNGRPLVPQEGGTPR